VRLWDTATAKQLQCLEGHTARVTMVAFSPDGRHIASASEDKTVRIWDIGTGRTAFEFKQHQFPVWGVAFSPDGESVASVSLGKDRVYFAKGEAIVWKTFTGKRLFERTGQGLSSVALSPDGRRLAVSGAIPSHRNEPIFCIRIWSLPGGDNETVLEGHRDIIRHIAFSPDGKQLVSSSIDQTVKLWDAATAEEFFTFHEEAAAYSAAFSPDGLRIASGSADHTVKLWAPPGNGPRTLGPGEQRDAREKGGFNVAYSPDGRCIASGTSFILDAISGKQYMRLHGEGYRMAWSPDGKRVATGNLLWDLDSGTGPRQLESPNLPENSDGGLFATGTAFSPDGKFLAGVLKGNTVGVWNVITGRPLHMLPTLTNYASCVAFSPDSQRLAVGTATAATQGSETLRIWDIATGKVVLTPEECLTGVNDVSFSPDGTLLAAAACNYQGINGEVRIWNAATGELYYTLRGHPNCVWGVAFSPDGKRLASAGGGDLRFRRTSVTGEVKIWDMLTGQAVCTLLGYKRTVIGVSFSPDGRRLATSSRDGTVKIWDGTPLAETPTQDDRPADE
jgi:WD40 repeat protein